MITIQDLQFQDWVFDLMNKLHVLFCIFFQMKEHEKALRIFVHNIGDFAEAEQYCNQITLGTIHILRTHFQGSKKVNFCTNYVLPYLRGEGSETDNFWLCLLLRIGKGVKTVCKCAYLIYGWPLRPTSEGEGNAFASFLDSSARYSCNQKVCTLAADMFGVTQLNTQ